MNNIPGYQNVVILERVLCFVPSEFYFRQLMKMVYCDTVVSKDFILALQSHFICYNPC